MAEIYIYRALRNLLVGCAFTERDFEGSIVNGGRWNSIGTPIVYASDHISTAGWEVTQKVNLDPSQEPDKSLRERILDILSETHSYYRVAIDTHQIITVEDLCGQALPDNWYRRIPGVGYRPDIQAIGDQWIKSKASLALRVPCVASRRHAFNYLLNPQHPNYPMLANKREGCWRFDGEALSPGTTKIEST
jgi:RES domain-containing protein